jgi:hypothetical protein
VTVGVTWIFLTSLILLEITNFAWKVHVLVCGQVKGQSDAENGIWKDIPDGANSDRSIETCFND